MPNRLAYFDEEGVDMLLYTASGAIAPVVGSNSFELGRGIWQPFEAPPRR